MLKIFLLPYLFCLFTVFLSVPLQGGEPRAYLYPTILETGKNLLPGNSDRNWKIPAREKIVSGRKAGGPFASGGTLLTIESDMTDSVYWTTSCRLRKDRTYLWGGWVRNRSARILFWFHGDFGPGKTRFNERIYYLAGVNRFLQPYFSDATLAKLGGGRRGWEICFKLLKTPEKFDLQPDFSAGSYFGTGGMDFGPLFVIDVTEAATPTGLTVHIENGPPIRTIQVLSDKTRDPIWVKNFHSPVRNFHTDVPGTHFAQKYILLVDYADGSRIEFAAPREVNK